jgi:hypothetical protein
MSQEKDPLAQRKVMTALPPKVGSERSATAWVVGY